MDARSLPTEDTSRSLTRACVGPSRELQVEARRGGNEDENDGEYRDKEEVLHKVDCIYSKHTYIRRQPKAIQERKREMYSLLREKLKRIKCDRKKHGCVAMGTRC